MINIHYHGIEAQRRLRPPTKKALPISSGFASLAYNYAWFNGSLPAYTTSNYSLLPVWNMSSMGENNEAWDVNTTMSYAELTCEPTIVSEDWRTASGEYFNLATAPRGKDDNTTFGTTSAKQDTWSLAENISTPWTSVMEKTYGNNNYMYMRGFAQSARSDQPESMPIINITVIHCTHSFYSQNVTANVGMPQGQINHVVHTSPPIPFDPVYFDQILAGSTLGIDFNPPDCDSHGKFTAFGYKPLQVPNSHSQLQRRLGRQPETARGSGDQVDTSMSVVKMENPRSLTDLVLFNRTKDDLGEMIDPDTLAASYKIALQFVFALLMADDMVSKNTNDIDQVAVVRHLLAKSFVVDRLWARGAQGGLAVITVIVAVLAILIAKRDLKLDGEPNSLAEALRMLAVSPQITLDMQNTEFYSPKKIGEEFGTVGGTYKLELVNNGPRLWVDGVRNEAILPEVVGARRNKPSMRKLWALRPWTGAAFLFAFGVIFSLLIAVFAFSEAHGGE